MSRRRKGQESGFALLFVLLAAAIIALMLYAELPRVAFEGQRLKEADLIARGEQYRQAIRLFVRRFGRYPPSIDALENTNNMRFLRRRYKDPMTGKDEWRLIHVGGGGFTDSLTMKPPKPAGTTDASELAASSSGGATDQQTAPQRWQLQRPGQTSYPGAASGNPDAQTGGGQTDYSQQQAAQGVPLAVPGQLGYLPAQQQPGDASVPGAAQPGALQPGDPGYAPGAFQPGQPGYQPMQGGIPVYQPGAPYQPGMPMQPGQRPYRPGGPAYGTPNQPLYPNVPMPGMPDSFVGNPSPNPASPPAGNNSSGPSSSSGSTSSGGGFGMMSAGAGIAGVASKYEAEGIKVYKDHTKYNEWEFIYDPRQEIVGLAGAQPPTGNQTGLSGAPGSGPSMGSQTGTQPGSSRPTY